jgi:nucleotide-binding universal stress UspA family protein
MSKTILLAVDNKSHMAALTQSVSELAAGGDEVIVLHVHEFAVGKFGRIQVDCSEGEGEKVADQVKAQLALVGITAATEIRSTAVGHIAKAIVDAAEEAGAGMIVLGASGPHDLPHLPFGSVSLRVLHRSTLPVLIVPRQPATVRSAVGDAAFAVS